MIGNIRQFPPLRFFVGSVLLAAVIVFLEKASNISSGGVGGLSIAISHFTGINVGVCNTIFKVLIFGFVFWQGGARLGVWTIISTLISGFFMWMFEMLPVPQWNTWIAFVLILCFSYLPSGLLLSKGYSTGGFSAVAQVLRDKYAIPLWLPILILNSLPIVTMYLTFGALSGVLTLLSTLWSGFATELWTRITTNILDKQSYGVSTESTFHDA